MAEIKGKSPFYPGQPILPELFTGREEQIRRIRRKGLDQVLADKSAAMFVQGEYGIGKSSVARYALSLSEKEKKLLGLYVTLGQAESLEDFGSALLESIVRTSSRNSTPGEKVKGFLGKYIKQVELFGVELNTEALRGDAAKLTSPRAILNLLGETIKRSSGGQLSGIFLILDEINGICSNPRFAHLLKDLVDTNAVENNPVPMLLMLCGSESRRFDLIRNHPPVGRIFDVIPIEPMSDSEIREFFTRAFNTVQTKIESVALDYFVHFSGGLPIVFGTGFARTFRLHSFSCDEFALCPLIGQTLFS